jgi:hypothetical protein
MIKKLRFFAQKKKYKFELYIASGFNPLHGREYVVTFETYELAEAEALKHGNRSVCDYEIFKVKGN